MFTFALVLFAGCSAGGGGGGLSPQVEFLWRQHPNPHPKEAAERAALEARALLAEHPDDIQLHYYYQDRMQSVDSDSLLREYQRRLDQNPFDPIAIMLEARARHSGPYLVTVMDDALAADSSTVEILALGVLASLGKTPADTAGARRLAERAMELHPDHHLANEALAMAYNAIGRHEEALEAAKRARSIHPWRYEPVGLMNNALSSLGRQDEATANTEEFFHSQPTHLPSFRRLVRVYEMAQDWEKLYQIEMIIAQPYPDNGFTWTYAAEAALKLGDLQKVMRAYKQAADWGWYDLPFIEHQMNDVQWREFQEMDGFDELAATMEASREADQDRLREMAIDNPIDVKLAAIEADDISGRTRRLADHRGRITVLHFFNLPEKNNAVVARRLAVLRERFPDVDVISMNALERADGASRLRLVIQDAEQDGITWPVWLLDDETASRLRVKSLPTFAVVDADGIARFRLRGYHPYVDDIIGYMIEEARTPVESLRGVMAN